MSRPAAAHRVPSSPPDTAAAAAAAAARLYSFDSDAGEVERVLCGLGDAVRSLTALETLDLKCGKQWPQVRQTGRDGREQWPSAV